MHASCQARRNKHRKLTTCAALAPSAAEQKDASRLDMHGNQWISIDIHGFPSTYMDSCAAKNCTFKKYDLQHCGEMIIVIVYPPCAAENSTFRKYDLQRCAKMVIVSFDPPCAAENCTFSKCGLQHCAKMLTMHMRKRSVPNLALH